MIECKPGNGAFQHILNSNAFIVCYLPQNIAVVKCNGAGKVNFHVLVVIVLHHIVFVEAGQAIVN